MTDRLGRYLEGDLDRVALTPEERAQAEAIEQVIEQSRGSLDARPVPDLTARVMRAVGQVAPPIPYGARARLLSPARDLWRSREVSIRLRPGLALGTLVAGLALWWLPVVSERPAVAPSQADGGAARLFVQFRLEAPEAASVRLAGSFTAWRPEHELHQTAPGVWTITVPLPLGVHDYSFVVDGVRWVPDPYAQAIDDGFGGTNSRLALLGPDDPRS